MVARPPLIRDLNQALLLAYLRARRLASRSQIQAEMGFSKATLNAILKELLTLGLVREERGPGGGTGRPARQLSLNPEAAYGVAAVLEPGGLKGAWVDFQGEIRGYHRVALRERTFSEVLEGLDGLLQQVKSSVAYPDRLAALAVAVPGSIDQEGRIRLSVKMPILEGLALAAFLAERYDLPTYVENDAKLAALGEKWAGDATGYKNLAFLMVKEGVGAGIILNDRLQRGTRGLAGEVGYLLVESDGEVISLEEALVTSRLEVLNLSPDSQAEENSLNRYAFHLTQVIIALTAVADLEAIFLDIEPQEWLPTLLERVGKFLMKTPYALELRPSRLSGEAPLYGAIALALGQTFEASLLGLRNRR